MNAKQQQISDVEELNKDRPVHSKNKRRSVKDRQVDSKNKRRSVNAEEVRRCNDVSVRLLTIIKKALLFFIFL